jgi:hypothetical protein
MPLSLQCRYQTEFFRSLLSPAFGISAPPRRQSHGPVEKPQSWRASLALYIFMRASLLAGTVVTGKSSCYPKVYPAGRKRHPTARKES